jgi:hypothetical protein
VLKKKRRGRVSVGGRPILGHVSLRPETSERPASKRGAGEKNRTSGQAIQTTGIQEQHTKRKTRPSPIYLQLGGGLGDSGARWECRGC